MGQDIYLFNDKNLSEQLKSAQYTFGYYTLRFYAENGRPVNRATETIADFYLYPSGGTLRDSSFNIVLYDSRFDTYRGFQLPHLRKPEA